MTKYNVRLTVCAVATTTSAVSTLIALQIETYSTGQKQADVFREDTDTYVQKDLVTQTLPDISSLLFSKIKQSISPDFIQSVFFSSNTEHDQSLGNVDSKQHQTTLVKESKQTLLSRQDVDTENRSFSAARATEDIGDVEHTLDNRYYQTTYYHPSNQNEEQLNCFDSKDCSSVPTIPEPINILSLSVIGGFGGAAMYQKYKQ